MQAIYISEFGGPENLEIREVPEPPDPASLQVTLKVKAAGLNRADMLQRRGFYPPPPGYSPQIPGLEFAGEVLKVGDSVKRFNPGDRVFGITAGEAQAEIVLTDESLLASIPENLSFTDAAAVPEAFITAYDAIFSLADLKRDETLLIHAVGSGVGLAALRLAKARGIRVIGTSRTKEKLEACKTLGLDEGIAVPVKPDFSEKVISLTDGHGADVILDLVGGAYFDQNLRSLRQKGRLLLVGLTSGMSAEFNLGAALTKRLTIIGTVLRSRSAVEKAEVTRVFEEEVVPLLASGEIRPDIDRVFPFTEVAEAHRYLESNESFGKVVLEF